MRRNPRVVSLSEHPRTRTKRQTGLLLPLLAAIFTGAVIGTSWPWNRPAISASASSFPSRDTFTCTVANVTDGDTFRCVETDESGRAIRIRLSGVAARETDGTCSAGHPCPAASAEDAKAELERLALSRTLSCWNVGETYGRVAAFCERADGVDLSCAMVESGTVLKWQKYWGSHSCPSRTLRN